jgi:hypothetical protein
VCCHGLGHGRDRGRPHIVDLFHRLALLSSLQQRRHIVHFTELIRGPHLAEITIHIPCPIENTVYLPCLTGNTIHIL